MASAAGDDRPHAPPAAGSHGEQKSRRDCPVGDAAEACPRRITPGESWPPRTLRRPRSGRLLSGESNGAPRAERRKCLVANAVTSSARRTGRKQPARSWTPASGRKRQLVVTCRRQESDMPDAESRRVADQRPTGELPTCQVPRQVVEPRLTLVVLLIPSEPAPFRVKRVKRPCRADHNIQRRRSGGPKN